MKFHLLNLRRALSHQLFPQSCIACAEPVQGLFCTRCQTPTLIHRPGCPICGQPGPVRYESRLQSPVSCSQCSSAPPPFSACRALFPYEGGVRQATLRLKYGAEDWVAKRIASALYQSFEALFGFPLSLSTVHAITYPPSNLANFRGRGFNPARLMAESLASRSRIPVYKGYILKRFATRPQSSLSLQERLRNLNDSFEITTTHKGLHPRSWRQRVLLIDDVTTTGATLRTCAQALREQGQAHDVIALTFSRTLPDT